MKMRSQARAGRLTPNLISEREIDTDALFEAAPRDFPPPPDLRRGFEKIVERIYDDDLDVLEEYEAIERALAPQDVLAPGALKVAKNNAEEVASRAYRLYLVARYEHAAYVRHTDAIVGAIREAATGRLQRQKKNGERTKQITDADVIGECASAYRDAWEEVCSRREKAQGMVDRIANLQLLAEKRVHSLAALLDPSRGRL